MSLTVLLPSQIQFIFKFSKEEKAQSIAGSRCPFRPQILSLRLLALISTSESGRAWDRFLLGQGRSCGLAGAAPSHPRAGRCFHRAVRFGEEVPGSSGWWFLQVSSGPHLGSVEKRPWVLHGTCQAKLQRPSPKFYSLQSRCHGRWGCPRGSGEGGMPYSVSQPTVPWVFPHSYYLLCNGRQGPHYLSLGFSSCDMSKGKTLTLCYCHCEGLSLGSSSTNNFESEGGSDNN